MMDTLLLHSRARFPAPRGWTLLMSGMIAISFPYAAAGTVFVDALGFEDDVDPVVSPNREFLVVSEESQDGTQARLKILDLDPATGEYLGELLILDQDDGILGFENAVDPLIISQGGAGGDYLILVPVESEDGSDATIYQFLTTALGVEIDRKVIDLGDLGFREDVDPTWTTYDAGGTPAIAFFVLESEDRSVSGILAIDADEGDGDWGACRLLSTDGRETCGTNDEMVDWLPGLADGVDPVALTPVAGFAYLWVPVSGADGSDLLRLTFDSDNLLTDQPPGFLGHISVKEANAGGEHPASFPGYERDVDLVVLEPGQCGATHSIVVPVEGPGDEGDLYRVNSDGGVIWMFSLDSGVEGASIPGYEAGVDLMVRCDLAPARAMVPIENAGGTDADLLIVDLDTGALLASVEIENGGFVLPGWEIGVDLIQWTDEFLVAPIEGPPPDMGLISMDFDGHIRSGILGYQFMGFRRSVDPIVVPFEPDPVLIVPFGRDDASDQDIHAFFFPPNLGGGVSLESIHAGLELGPYEWDVDLGYIDTALPGAQWLCLPEESEGGGDARLRFEPISPSYPTKLLAVATEATDALSATLHLVDMQSGNLTLTADDVLGLETGLDMLNGHGPVMPPASGEGLPSFPRPTGVDQDGDPTLAWEVAASAVESAIPQTEAVRLSAPPFGETPSRIRYFLPSSGEMDLGLVDAAGRVVRRFFRGRQSAGEHEAMWDGRDGRGFRLASGVYFIHLRTSHQGAAHKKVVIVK